MKSKTFASRTDRVQATLSLAHETALRLPLGAALRAPAGAPLQGLDSVKVVLASDLTAQVSPCRPQPTRRENTW